MKTPAVLGHALWGAIFGAVMGLYLAPLIHVLKNRQSFTARSYVDGSLVVAGFMVAGLLLGIADGLLRSWRHKRKKPTH